MTELRSSWQVTAAGMPEGSSGSIFVPEYKPVKTALTETSFQPKEPRKGCSEQIKR